MPVTRSVAIPLREIELRASRSSGPGGQHANVTASRIEAVFDVRASAALSEAQRAARSPRGSDRSSAPSHRTPAARRATASSRSSGCAHRLAGALAVQRPRRATRPTRSSKEARLKSKRTRSATKRDRRRPAADD